MFSREKQETELDDFSSFLVCSLDAYEQYSIMPKEDYIEYPDKIRGLTKVFKTALLIILSADRRI